MKAKTKGHRCRKHAWRFVLRVRVLQECKPRATLLRYCTAPHDSCHDSVFRYAERQGRHIFHKNPTVMFDVKGGRTRLLNSACLREPRVHCMRLDRVSSGGLPCARRRCPEETQGEHQLQRGSCRRIKARRTGGRLLAITWRGHEQSRLLGEGRSRSLAAGAGAGTMAVSQQRKQSRCR